MLGFSNFLLVLISIILLLKMFAEMDRYFKLRVFILTLILSCLVFYCFVDGFTPLPPGFDCLPLEG
jgi:hypothetical protein